jgi:CIC family chloride channel protein
LYGEGYGLINNLLNGKTEAALNGIQYQIDFNNVWIVIAI